MKPWATKSVRELQLYLKDRGVTYTNELKASLVQLCSDAESMGLEIDPDGLHEDRAEILAKKLVIGDVTLQCPTLLTNCTNNIAVIPLLSICDLYSYLMSFDDYTLATFRDVEKMEGYTMAMDGFVLDMDFAVYPETPKFMALKSRVKPRTQEKDPITKLKHYNVWIVMTSNEESRIHSAYCTCKGG